MLPTKFAWPLLLTAVSLSFFTNCSDDDGGCQPGKPCPCHSARGCIYDCPETGCRPLCNSVDFCDATCGADCGYSCTSVSACDVDCGAGCDVECIDVSDCHVEVGPGSEVLCQRLSNCDVACQGECRVQCLDAGACNVNCADGSSTDCGGGVHVCGQSC